MKIVGMIIFVAAVWPSQAELPVARAIQQSTLEYIGENLGVNFEVVNNTNGNDANYDAVVSLRNNGNSEITQDVWEIYFYVLLLVEPDHLRDGSYEVPGTGMRVSHVNGILFKMAPTNNFKTLTPGGTLEIPLVIDAWSVSRSDVMPMWYVAAGELEPVVIRSTEDIHSQFVADFTRPSQYKRYSYDEYHPFSAEDRFNRFGGFDAEAAAKLIIPTPWKIEQEIQTVTITNDWAISCLNYTSDCGYLSDRTSLQIVNDNRESSIITVMAGDVSVDDNLVQRESYSLHIMSERVELVSPTSDGIFNAMQSLLSLWESSGGVLPLMNIIDAPRFPYRGMHLDVGRNFVQKDDVILLLQTMATYKLNKFHFHLTDDEGWRVEMDSCPELTSVGGKRLHDLSETKGILPQLGSGPTSQSSGSGFYTKEDYKEILAVASEHHIQVIPEVDLPGHAHAAIKANFVYYKRMIDEMGQEAANEVLISDLNDSSKYLSTQLFTDNAVNPCIAGTYLFITNFVKDFVKLHEESQELSMIHIGGDEIANAWLDSPKCNALYKDGQLPSGERDLLEYFWTNAMHATTNASEVPLTIGVWEDGVLGKDGDDKDIPYNKTALSKNDIVAYAWQNIWEWGVANRAYLLANAGYKVVMSHATHLYFDQPNEPDPEERGLYWASRFTDSFKTFSFMPEDLYSNSDVKRSGESYPENTLCSENTCTPLERPENIIGMQGQLWSETVRNTTHLHYMIFPRLLALAERAWHKADWESTSEGSLDETGRSEDWGKFAAALGKKELTRLDFKGIEYRVPLPGARIQDKEIEIGCEFPGMTVRYRKNGDLTWNEAACGGSIPYSSSHQYELQTISVGTERRFSRSAFVGVQSSSAGLSFNLACLFVTVLSVYWNVV